MGNPRILSKWRRAVVFIALLCISVAGAWLWTMFVAPQILKLSEDFVYSADIISVNDSYNESAQEFSGPEYSEATLIYEAKGVTDGVLNVRGAFRARTLDGGISFNNESIYGIRATTGEHVPGFGDADRSGYLFAPALVREGDSYRFWHVGSDVSAEMKFVDVEFIHGLKVFKFRSDYGGVIDQTASLAFLEGVGETRGVRLQSVLEVWIEPTTGYLVKLQDYSTDYYLYDINSQERISPYRQFSNIYSEQSVVEHTERARWLKYRSLITRFAVPLALFIILILLGLLHFSTIRMLLKKQRAITIPFIIILLISVAGAVLVHRIVQGDIYHRLVLDAKDLSSRITDHMKVYEDVLFGERAFFYSSDTVTRDEWKVYYNTLQLQKRYPGVLGNGFAPYILADQREEFVNTVKGEGFLDYSIRPSGERSAYTPIKYIEPFSETNQRAFGYDMYSDATRRAAMILAEKSGEAAMSGPVVLVQEQGGTDSIGGLLYVPMYRDEQAPLQYQEDRELIGFVYFAFRLSEFLEAAVRTSESQVSFRVYDGPIIDTTHLLYPQSPLAADVGAYSHVQTLFLAGRVWTLETYYPIGYRGSFLEQIIPYVILFGGLILGLLLWALAYSQYYAKERIQQRAELLTEKLQTSNVKLETQNIELEERVRELDIANAAMVDRELKMIELKNKLKSYE